MLNKIILSYFKCFKQNSFPLSKLTVLSGENSSGKSTVIQSITLIHQMAAEDEYGEKLPLNGQTICLGRCEDIISRQFGRDSLMIALHDDYGVYEANFLAKDRSSTSIPLNEGSWTSLKGKSNPTYLESPLIPKRNPKSWSSFLEKLQGVTYLSADRTGPKEVFTLEGSQRYYNVGPKGERTLWYLNEYGEEEVLKKLRRKDSSPLLIRQVESWMNTFFPGFKMELIPVKRTNLATVGFLTNSATGYLRPQNIGFGLSYTLPIFVSCLGAVEDDVILIENPEAHLHPRGQSMMGEFLARIASAGIQVVLETHSDHILNGVRKAVKAHILEPNDLRIHFFSRPDNSDLPRVFSPEIDAQGNISDWPAGFFDQFDKDLEVLTEWGV